jgi:hypothetical protein
MSTNERLPEVLVMAAMTIEELFKQLEREPPLEAQDLIKELRECAQKLRSN